MMKMNSNLYELYQQTLATEIDNDSYNVVSMGEGSPHRIGCSSSKTPMLFIECCNNEKVSDIKLSLFRVLFNRKCALVDVEKRTREEKTFSIIEMKSTDEELVKYFFQVLSIVLQKLPNKPVVSELKQEVSKVIEIFKLPPKFSKEVVRGLWAELLIIEKGADPEYLLKAWHEDPEDKYDFNDSIDKLEVKSTKGDFRIHVFSIEQLNPNPSSKLLIASVFVNAVGEGVSIFDLEDSIDKRVTNVDLKLKLKEIILTTIGPHIDESAKLKFDYKFASDTLRLYDYKLIPSIKKESIPVEVSGVSFRSDITGVMSIDEYDFKLEGKLFSSL